MKIRDIVNRDIVNLENCEQEPIHIPGSIQPHGFLLGLKGNNLIIDFCSANTAEYLAMFYTELLGKEFGTIFGTENAKRLLEVTFKQETERTILLPLQLAGIDFLCTIHQNAQGIYILEGEPKQLGSEKEVYDHTELLLRYMHDSYTLKELCQLVAEGTRDITGYDRVMIYRFDKDYNGEVFAESCREDLEPFLGLHYPHTDIPPQARELYMKNLLRLLTDIDYTPVPIYTIDEGGSIPKTLDMSLGILRSTSPIHVQYLNNMGVGATLTISLIHKKKLWGLIACHHYSPKNLTPGQRQAALLQGHFITSQIDLRQASEEYELSKRTTYALEKMNSENLLTEDDMQKIVVNPNLLSVCNASGVSITYNGEIYSNGLTPAADKITLLANWLANHTNQGNLHTEKISSKFNEFSTESTIASGIVYHSLNINNSNCIIWYRPESKTEVNWAGDPSKSIIKNEKGLSPRRSFALWKQIVDSTSKPWLRPELESAASYAYALQRQITLLIISREEEKYRKLSELLKETNSELENINWISTHDLQEPLRKIQLIASHILSMGHKLPENVENSIKRMNLSANRMQTLLVDILKYTRLKHNEDALVTINMEAILQEVLQDMTETISEKNAAVIINKLPEIKGIPFLLKQLFFNLIANSIKYSNTNIKPIITISAEEVPQPYKTHSNTTYWVIKVSDNGMGFEQKYAEQIFNIFTRLHSIPDHKGSGVGLALCKKIMQNHKGYITANSVVDIGTTINLYFPV